MLTREFPAKKPVPNIANYFVHPCMELYDKASLFLIDNGFIFVSKVFVMARELFEMMHMKTATYHLQTSRQVKC